MAAERKRPAGVDHECLWPVYGLCGTICSCVMHPLLSTCERARIHARTHIEIEIEIEIEKR